MAVALTSLLKNFLYHVCIHSFPLHSPPLLHAAPYVPLTTWEKLLPYFLIAAYSDWSHNFLYNFLFKKTVQIYLHRQSENHALF
jgi:hypothetical protein